MGVEFPAKFNEPNLRVVAGSFDDAVAATGSGFSVVDDATAGQYTITFNRAYSTLVSFVCSAEGAGAEVANVKTDYVASTGVLVVQFFDAANPPAGADLASGDRFHFIAVFQE